MSIFKKKTKSLRMNRWILEMKEYRYSIQYIKGEKSVIADSLSRPILLIQQFQETTWLGKSREEIRTFYKKEER